MESIHGARNTAIWATHNKIVVVVVLCKIYGGNDVGAMCTAAYSFEGASRLFSRRLWVEAITAALARSNLAGY